MRLTLLVFLASMLWWSAPARACDLAEFLTPFELLDRAAVVAVTEVVAAPKHAGQVRLSVIDTLKGSAGSEIEVETHGGSCDPSFAVGMRGIVFTDGSGQVVGAYDGFLAGGVATWTDALRRYHDGATDAERAAPLLEMAISKDWTRSFRASFALADRVELLLALDATSIDRLFARMKKVAKDHPLVRVAARLHDARLAPLLNKRGMGSRDDVKALRTVIAGPFEAESDVGVLADVIADVASSTRRRAAALERCERVHGRTLDRFTDYIWGEGATWAARADACRTGAHV